jgi:AcrR family transcriptional regulator
MKNNDLEAKKQIIEVTKGLIREYGDASKITIRDICNKANVGVGLVNYHFQTKENLINTCIQEIIENLISGFDALEESLLLEPLEKIKYLLKLNMKFLVDNSGLSKVSIMGDLISGDTNDNSYQTRDAYLRLLKKIYGQRKTEYEIKVILYTVISTLQVVFLRMEVIKKTDGLDLLDEKQRDMFINSIVEMVFYDLKQ